MRFSGGGEFIFDKYLNDTTKFDFKGIKIDIPKEYDEYLTFLYGDWRTPVQWANFEMSYFQKLLVKIKYIIKNNLPPTEPHYNYKEICNEYMQTMEMEE